MLTLRDAELSADSAVIDISQVRNLYLENVTFDLPEGEEKWQIEPGDNENLFIDGKSLRGTP